MADSRNQILRQTYDQKILASERKLDQLSDEQRQTQKEIHSVENDVNYHLQQLQALNDELVQEGSHSVSWTQENIRGALRYFQKVITEQQEELTKQYEQAEMAEIEARQTLLKERNELGWD